MSTMMKPESDKLFEGDPYPGRDSWGFLTGIFEIDTNITTKARARDAYVNWNPSHLNSNASRAIISKSPSLYPTRWTQ